MSELLRAIVVDVLAKLQGVEGIDAGDDVDML
jgi:hypothetical protein